MSAIDRSIAIAVGWIPARRRPGWWGSPVLPGGQGCRLPGRQPRHATLPGTREEGSLLLAWLHQRSGETGLGWVSTGGPV